MDHSESISTKGLRPRAGGVATTLVRRFRASSASRALAQYAWIPIPILLALILALRYINFPATAEPWYLLPLLNLVFLSSIALVVAFLASRSFAQSGSIPILLFGCGSFSLAIANLLAGVLLAMGRVNGGLTAHNTIVLLAALCHLPVAVLVVSGRDRIVSHVKSIGAISYGVALLVVGLLYVAAYLRWTPVFYDEATGPTVIRRFVLGSSAALYMVAASMICLVTGRRDWVFGWWYGLGLALFATGLFGVLIADRVADAVSWAGRAAQYAGGMYMAVAVILSIRERGRWDTPLRLALTETQARLRIRAEATFEGIAIAENGIIIDANEQLTQMLAWSTGGLIGTPLIDVLPVLETADEEDADQTPTREYSVVAQNGRLLHVEVRSRTMRHQGRRVRYYAIRDITNRKIQEEALLENESRLRIAASAAGLGIFVWYPVEDVAHWETDQMFAILGDASGDGELTRTELFQRYVLPDDAPVLDAALAKSMAPGRSVHTKFRIRRTNDGAIRVLELFGRFDESADEPLRLIGVVTDVTERTHAEEALRLARDELEGRVAERTGQLQQRADQLARLTSELTLAEQRERRRLAQVLHDHLQQLLVGAKFGLEVLSRRVPAEQKNDVDQLLSLLGDSIAASRSLTVELFPPILHEGGLAAGIEWLARWMGEKHGLHVEFSADPEAVTSREDVRVLLFQSVRELLFNVVKHARVTEAHVELRRGYDNNLIVVVEDFGAGFEPGGIRPGYAIETVGFGLVSIRERVAMLGGSFEVESAPGHGARFTLTAPIYLRGPVQTLDSTDVSGPAVTSGAKRAMGFGDGTIRVLLVDDHAVMRQGLSFLLSHEIDVEVVGEASNGYEAVEKALELRPDVILMDFSMPKLDGLEATRRIHSALPDIRIIGLSMYEEADRAEAMIEAGAEAYLSKSGDSDILLAEIRGLQPRTVTI